MKRKILNLISASAVAAIIYSCSSSGAKLLLSNVENAVLNPSNNTTTAVAGLSNDDIISGLKEALVVGANNSGTIASKTDGFYKNPALFIPWPPEAIKMKEKLTQLGFSGKITEFETSLNRAAEEATKSAAPIFVNAVKSMTLTDGIGILKGGDSAATHFLRDKTTQELKDKFKPTVTKAIETVKVTQYWKPLADRYNMLPGVSKVNPDLNDYVTSRAVQGMFKLVLDEEKKIRKDPVARVTDILKKVFGSKEAGN